MGELFSPSHLIVISVLMIPILAIGIVPYWQILKKAGFAPALSLLMVVPMVNVILLYYVAFSQWAPARE